MRVFGYLALALAAVGPALWMLWPAGEAPLPAANAQTAPANAAHAFRPCPDSAASGMARHSGGPAVMPDAPAIGTRAAGGAVTGAAPCPFAPSLVGTRADGNVRQDAAAHLIVDEELAHLFDYYLSALGEQPLPAIRASIERELRQHLSPAAAAEAIHLLDRYIAYKHALAGIAGSLPAAPDRIAAARNRLDAMQRLRADYFSAAELAGLFGASDARDRDALSRLEDDRQAAQRANPGAAANDAAPGNAASDNAAQGSALSAAERAERDAPLRILTLEATVQQARSRGADDNDIYRLRATALSPEAAARLADVDREEADWQRRIAGYRAARNNIPAANAAALQQLRDTQFTPQEQKRLTAYE